MDYSLNAGAWNSVFAVPAGVVDNYIKLADGNSLKLLLYLLRHGGRRFSENELKDALGFRRDGELEDAALFWVQRGIISAENGILSPADNNIGQQQYLPEFKEPVKTARRITDSDKTAGIYTASDIAERINSDKAIAGLFIEAQKIFGRTLRQPESRVVLSLVDLYGLPPEVALMLLNYCFKSGNSSISYIQSTASLWAEEGIKTVGEADTKIGKLEKRHSIEERIKKAMGLNTNFTPKQLKYIKTWTEDWQFGEEMIMLAYEFTVDNTSSMSFPYANKILENWKNSGLTTKEAVERDAAARKSGNKKQAAGGRSSFDVDDVMQRIYKKYQDQ